MQNNICDNCGKSGILAPQTKVKTEINHMDVSTPDPKNIGEHIIQKVPYEKPVMVKVRRQNIFTGKMEETEEPQLEDLQDRIIRVELAIGFNERISREFCVKCIESIKSELKNTWKMLEGFEPK